MAAGNRGVGEAQAGGRLAADDHRLFADREDAALKFAGDGCQSWIHLQVRVSKLKLSSDLRFEISNLRLEIPDNLRLEILKSFGISNLRSKTCERRAKN